MAQKLEVMKIDVDVTGAVTGAVLKDRGQAYKLHLQDIILEASGAGVVTIRDKYDAHIMQKTFSATDKFLNITAADLFGGGGRLMIDISTGITVKGTIMYWSEDLGHSQSKSDAL